MSETVQTLIAVLAILQIKHFLCDFPLQTLYQLRNKGNYLHPGGVLHAGQHALLTTAAFVVAPPSFSLGLTIVVVEFLLHYHIDWTKEQLLRRNGWQTTQNAFWWALGADQMIHHLTYLAIGALLVSAQALGEREKGTPPLPGTRASERRGKPTEI